jgi:hypothetical protein
MERCATHYVELSLLLPRPNSLPVCPAFPHDLTREALWIFGAPVSVPDATGSNIDLVVSYRHGRRHPENDD